MAVSTEWMDDIITSLIEGGELNDITVLRAFLLDERNKDNIKEENLKYFYSTLFNITEGELSEDKTGFIAAWSQLLAAKPSQDENVLRTQLLESCLTQDIDAFESCKLKLLKHLLHHKKEEVYFLVVEFQLFTAAQGLLSSGLESLQNWTENKETVDTFFKLRHRLMVAELNHLDLGGATVEQEDAGCSVIVDPECTKRVENGIIYVNKLQDGFQICKNGGVLWIRNGDYAASDYLDINLTAGKRPLEIIGESCSECCINGSLRIMSAAAGITLRNIKFEIGDSAESTASINIFGGVVNFKGCVLECFSNTAIYIRDNASKDGGKVSMENCFVEGLQSCQRIFALQPQMVVDLDVDTTYFNEAFSVLTSIQDGSSSSNSPVNLGFNNCVFNEVQDGIRLLQAVSCSSTVLTVQCSTFNLVLYDEESGSSAVALSNFKSVNFSKNKVTVNHTQGAVLDLKTGESAAVAHSLFLTAPELDRRLSTSTAVKLNSVLGCDFKSSYVFGFRLGLSVRQCGDVIVEAAKISTCAAALYSPDKSSSRQIRLQNGDIESVFHGVLLEGGLGSLNVHNTQFTDVLHPIAANAGCNVDISKSAATKSRELVDYASVSHNTDEHSSESKSLLPDLRKSQVAVDLTIHKVEARHGRKDGRTKKNTHDADNDGDDNDDQSNDNTQEDELKLYLIAVKNLPYQISTERPLNLFSIPTIS